ncbi:uncharacterized protein PV09_04684 [Verruconis gallopava]|uniref:Class E vacuolar protein-sorting machinery protein HSE1 n=1 Tax=Verruconis gallopava TaxID=253628 RepID=A0A0D2AC30_9PEZI|nr:uncharacterized protein PV09_04684 [Verruconis gallopava]KIW04408.1 hypothetical protein PV09_04684 [Verruconis gallopava]
MFRTQQNAFDDVVVKATDENLTSENWELIMAVVDKVSEADSGSKDAVAAMIKRLAHRNANVQLYTLELANALSQNCGMKMHKELASRSFTEALLRLAGDRNTHQQVKAKILERMAEWTEMFKHEPDLGIMEQAYMRLKTQNPNLHPPSKPQKTQLSEADRRREEEELQMALALSMKDSKAAATSSASPAQGIGSQTPAEEPTPAQQGTTAATVSRVRALYDFTPSEPGELAFRKGDIIAVIESVYKDWWKGSLKGATGIFPLNYVEKLQDPTREELEREAQMESEVFNQIGNVEKLLALLSVNDRGDVRDNEEVTELYHKTLSIRPKLIELIGKYSQKKDDMTQLNERFIKARRDYETLLEASMSHPVPQTYGRPSYGGYSTGPQSGYGAPPSQANQYATAYQQQIATPPSDPRYSSPPPQQQAEPSYPPQNGPQPFYFVPPGQSSSTSLGQAPPPRTTSAAAQSTDDLYTHPSGPARTTTGLGDARRQTIAFGSQPGQIGIPQELASGSFDSPVNSMHEAQKHQYDPYPVQQPGKAPSDPYGGAPLQQATTSGTEGGYPAIGRPGGLSTLPSQQRMEGSSPVYQPFGAQYTPYNPSAATAGRPAAAGGGGDESYYR